MGLILLSFEWKEIRWFVYERIESVMVLVLWNKLMSSKRREDQRKQNRNSKFLIELWYCSWRRLTYSFDMHVSIKWNARLLISSSRFVRSKWFAALDVGDAHDDVGHRSFRTALIALIAQIAQIALIALFSTSNHFLHAASVKIVNHFFNSIASSPALFFTDCGAGGNSSSFLSLTYARC